MRTHLIIASALLAAGAVAACAGEPPSGITITNPDPPGTTPDNTDSQAYLSYEQNVFPLLVEECSGCHVEGAPADRPWMDIIDAETNYNTMRVYGELVTPSSCSQLILKSLGEHAGPALSPSLEEAVTAWLALEEVGDGLVCDTGGGSGDDPPPDTVASCESMMEEFQSCMYQAHWDGTGMDLLPLQQTAGEGNCAGCHSQGVGSAFLSADSEQTFEKHKTDRFFLQKLVGCAYSNGEVAGLVATDRYLNKGAEPCGVEPCHPDYLLNADNQQAVADYVQGVVAAMEAGTCAELESYGLEPPAP